jgi:hypothetical protein
MIHGHPITPGKPPLKGKPIEGASDEHWYARYRKHEQKLAAEEAASGKTLETHGSTEIERLRDMLARRTPKDVDYKDISQQLARAYADAYPGMEEDDQ